MRLIFKLIRKWNAKEYGKRAVHFHLTYLCPSFSALGPFSKVTRPYIFTGIAGKGNYLRFSCFPIFCLQYRRGAFLSHGRAMFGSLPGDTRQCHQYADQCTTVILGRRTPTFPGKQTTHKDCGFDIPFCRRPRSEFDG